MKSLYSSLKLKKHVFKAVIEAHNEILEYGLSTGNEMVIAIEIKTGKKVAQATGSPTRVNWNIESWCKSDVIAIHNHPSNGSFSPVDLYTFNRRRQIEFMSIQGHNGIIYSLRKIGRIKYKLEEETLSKEFLDFIERPDQRTKNIYE